MWYDLLLMWLGAAIMLFIVWVADRQERRRIAALAAAVCSDKEYVRCYNATVIVSNDGAVTWFDNERIEWI